MNDESAYNFAAAGDDLPVKSPPTFDLESSKAPSFFLRYTREELEAEVDSAIHDVNRLALIAEALILRDDPKALKSALRMPRTYTRHRQLLVGFSDSVREALVVFLTLKAGGDFNISTISFWL